jgi:hypothetical protein
MRKHGKKRRELYYLLTASLEQGLLTTKEAGNRCPGDLFFKRDLKKKIRTFVK